MRDCAPLVSIIIPTRNRCALTLRALLSALGQTEGSREIILVDDASTIDLDPLRRFVARHPEIRLLTNRERRGAAAARNQGVAAARGAFVAFLDSDDCWLPLKLAHQLACFRTLPANSLLAGGLAYARLGRILERGYPAKGAATRVADYLYLQGGVLQTSTFFMPRAVAQGIQFDATLAVQQDTDFLLRAEAAGVNIAFDAEVVAILDTNQHFDRITTRPDSWQPSHAWFDRVSVHWSPEARQAYLRGDDILRYTRAHGRWAGLRRYLQNLGGLPKPGRDTDVWMMLAFGPRHLNRMRHRLSTAKRALLSRAEPPSDACECFWAYTAEAERQSLVPCDRLPAAAEYAPG